MSKFRKKPEIVEAKRYDGSGRSGADICDWARSIGSDWLGNMENGPDGLRIRTLEDGWLNATAGDWIISGVKGEFYFCKPDIFAATYEAVPDDD